MSQPPFQRGRSNYRGRGGGGSSSASAASGHRNSANRDNWRQRPNNGQNTSNNNGQQRGGNNNNVRNNANNNRGQGGTNVHGIMYLHEFEQIQKDIRGQQLLMGSSDLLDRLNVPAVFHRMNRMFREVQKQEEFIGLILETAKTSLRQEQLRQMGQLFVRRILETEMVQNLMTEHISKIRYDPLKREPPIAKIAEHLCGLLTLGWQSMPTFMAEHLQLATDSTIASLQFPSIQSETFPTERTKQLLAEIHQLMQNQFSVTEVNNTVAGADANAQQNNAERNNSYGPPPEDFRMVQVSPREADFLLYSNAEVYLRKAIIAGPYQNDEHYLDVQFRLMREDLYRPLRDGIAQFRRLKSQAQIAGQQQRSLKTDLFIYSGVHLDGMELHKESGGLLAYFQLNRNDRRKRLHKCLMFGALVCLSTDQFQHHFLFGTIVDQDKLEQTGCVGVNLLSANEGIGDGGGRRPAIQFNVAYSMVESPAFYEAYKHVLTALQAFPNGTPIPFSKYFVHLNPDVSIPRYLTTANAAEDYLDEEEGMNWRRQHQLVEERDLDFECLLTENAKLAKAENNQPTKCKPTQIGEHFGPEDFGMDQSQFDALVHAIRSDLAVIQGPPGTGKTYLGLKLVELLFANERFWAYSRVTRGRRGLFRFLLQDDEEDDDDNAGYFDDDEEDEQIRRPMLVVCYTNHALDQFLEGMIPFLKGNGIVRVGGRCKNDELLNKFTLGKLRAERRYHINEYILDGANRQEYYDCRQKLKEILESRDYWKKACQIPGWILENSHLIEVAAENPIGANSNFLKLLHSRSKFCLWLCQSKLEGKQQLEMDVDFVRKFVNEMGLREIEARALAFMAAKQTTLKNIKKLSRNIRNQIYHTINMDPKFAEETAHWPKLDTFNQFGGIFAQCENLAIQWLQSVNNQSGPIFEHLQQNMGVRIAAAGIGNNQQQKANDGGSGREEQMVEKEQQNVEMENEDDDDDERRAYGDNSEDENGEQEEEEELVFANWAAEIQKLGLEKGQAQHLSINLKEWMEKNSRLRIFFLQRTRAMERAEAIGWLERDDPWAMPLHQRWRLYRFWADAWANKEAEKQEENVAEYYRLNQRYQYFRGQADLAILKRAKVIGMTTTGAARLQCSLRSLKPRIVVVEEAAEVFEPHIVTSLTECCEHLILIGDHQQLRPNPSDYRLGKDYHLDISLFERLVNNGFQFQTLRKQHRMRPEISRPLMPHFYQDLEDDESVFGRDDVQGMQKNVFFISHNEAECSQRKLADGKSKANPFEAEFAVRIAKYLTQQEYSPEQITILCTYVEQMFDVRSRMKTAFPAPLMAADQLQNSPQKAKSIRVDVVDNYQGEECDIIILSMVRSNHPEGKIGFLNIPNRVCVALSRAKLGFYVLGNFDYLAEKCHGEQPALWSDIRQSMLEQNAIGRALPIVCKMHSEKQEIETAAEFMEKSPEGGCCRPCDCRLDCGHTCDKFCHAYDIDHSKAKCLKKCAKMCENDLHQSCQLQCYEKCRPCTEIIDKTLLCGHSTRAKCHIPIENVQCNEKCQLKLPCGHMCEGRCSARCPPCGFPTFKQLPCGHRAEMKCSQPAATFNCKELVKKEWPICGHLVQTECHSKPEQMPCPTPCKKAVMEGNDAGGKENKDNDGCDHQCKGTCGQCRNGRLHIECKEICKRILICDHECGSKCSAGCPPCDRPCETRCGHSQCCMAGNVEGEAQRKLRKWENQKKGKEGRRCGELCPPCQEPCLNGCPHRQCSKRCSEQCDVQPCNEPCAKRLKCSPPQVEEGYAGPNLPLHLCAGVCSEKCIEICRICEPEKFQTEIIEQELFMVENEPDARFVQLQDCGHYVEVNSLDQWVQGKVEEVNVENPESTGKQILQIPCPRCRAPIRRSKRYIALLNKRAMEIEQIKMKIIGSKSKAKLEAQWTLKKTDILTWLKEWNATLPQWSSSTYAQIFQAIVDIQKRLQNFPKVNVTAQWMNFTLKNIENILLKMKNRIEKLTAECPTSIVNWAPQLSKYKIDAANVQTFLLQDMLDLMQCISASGAIHSLTGVTFKQLDSEMGRNEFMLNLFKFMKKVPPPSTTSSAAISELETDVLEILRKINGQKRFIEIHQKLDDRLRMLANKHGIPGLGISREEFIQIHHAFQGDIGAWYRCSKGHFYNITNCGGAMEHGQCPECQEVIGGAQHQLVSSSQQAAELTNLLARNDPRVRQEFDPFEVRYH